MSLTVKGWLKDPPDIKYRSFSDVHRAFIGMATPKALAGGDYDIPNEPPCYDQGDIGSCVLNATCGALNIVLAVEGKTTAMLSRLFLYWLCRLSMGTLNQDSGTFTHLAVDRVGKIGVCGEDIWPYGDSNLFVPPPPESYTGAADNKATAWFRIDTVGGARLDQLEAAIRSNHPIIYGSPVSSAIQYYQAGQVLTIPNQSDIIGGHSTCFTGVRYMNGQRVWRVRNSWGTDWGDNGHFLMDDAWAGWAALSDLWVLTRVDPLMF